MIHDTLRALLIIAVLASGCSLLVETRHRLAEIERGPAERPQTARLRLRSRLESRHRVGLGRGQPSRELDHREPVASLDQQRAAGCQHGDDQQSSECVVDHGVLCDVVRLPPVSQLSAGRVAPPWSASQSRHPGQTSSINASTASVPRRLSMAS